MHIDSLQYNRFCKPWFCAALIAALTFGVYLQTYSFDYLNFDDPSYVLENPYVRTGLSWTNIVWAFTETKVGHWHPLTWISLMLDCAIFGTDPGAHHVVNALFHTLNAVAVFWLLLRLQVPRMQSVFIALVFAIHPLRIESVAWISERKDVLSLFFGLLTFHSYLSWTSRKRISSYGSMILFLTLSLLAKPMFVIMPFLLLLIDLYPLRRLQTEQSTVSIKEIIRSLFEKLPLFVPVAICSAMTLWAQTTEGAVPTLDSISLGDRFSNVVVGYAMYFGRLFWPAELGIFYPRTEYSISVVACAAVFLIAVTTFCVHQVKTAPYLLFGWAWFLISLLPVIGFIQVGGQSIADRWTYLPHIGLILGVTLWISDLKLPQRLARARVPVALAAISLLTAKTLSELPNWRDSESVFRRTLAISEDNFMAHTNLGVLLDQQGRYQEARRHFELAYQQNPTYPDAINNLGLVHARTGEFDQAIKLFERALSIRPRFTVASRNLSAALHAKNYTPE